LNTAYRIAARFGVTDQLDGTDRWRFHRLQDLTRAKQFARFSALEATKPAQ
jgi:hypothetical protein